MPAPAPLGFDRHARLHRPVEFEVAFAHGRRYNDKHLAALVLATQDGGARLGLAVPKKIAADASDRNRIKRQVRESFRRHRSSLPQADIVILARPGSPQASAVQLRENLERLWQKIISSSA